MPSLPLTGEYRSGHTFGRARHTPPPSATPHIGSSKSQYSSLPHALPTKPPHGSPLPVFVSSPPHAPRASTVAIASSLIATRIPRRDDDSAENTDELLARVAPALCLGLVPLRPGATRALRGLRLPIHVAQLALGVRELLPHLGFHQLALAI